MGGEEVELYAHEPLTLLPLIEAHLPYSLSIYGVLKTSPPVRLDRPWSSIPLLPNGKDKVDSESLHGAVWCTFPPGYIPSVEDDDHPWAVILHLPSPQTSQARQYCSAERVLSPLTIAAGPHPSSLPHDDPRFILWRAGQDLMNGLVRTSKESSPVISKFGAVNILWTDEIGGILGRELKPVTDAFIAPEGFQFDLSKVDKTGLVVDTCTDADCDLVCTTRDIKEDLSYYLKRKDYITIIRTAKEEGKEQEAVSWIMTHAAGDQGALYTIPGFRRRGLAKWVVSENLKREQKRGNRLRGYVWVTGGNEASASMWRGMGWGLGWKVRWMYV